MKAEVLSEGLGPGDERVWRASGGQCGTDTGSGISPGAGSGVPPHMELAVCEGQRLFKKFHP